jgi:predicted Zn-dependent protease with MMP-like domain
MAVKISARQFDDLVKKAIDRIPDEIRLHLDNMIITVRSRPSAEIMKSLGIKRPNGLFGLFQGVPLTERSVTAPPLFPDTILLFQEALEGACANEEELAEQIEITVVHEVAHFIGMTEERLWELGYG